MTRLIVKSLELKDPTWGAAQSSPGQEINLSVTGEVSGDQWIEFRIRTGDTLVDVVDGKPGEKSCKWIPSAVPDETPLRFDAVLRQKPGPKNGHQSALGQVVSPQISLKPYKVELTSVDSAFVPKQEKLEVKYKVTDPSSAAKKGRILIWGERYPKDEYVYFKDFVPAAGEHTWSDWDGKANHGYLDNKYISPEFSPYRLQIIIGPDEDSVKEPFGKGAGRASLVEKQFEIKFQTIVVRVAANLSANVTNLLKPDDTLVVEPRTEKGAYVHRGRTPLEKEPEVNAGWAPGGEGDAAAKDRKGIGRIRVACKRHNIIGESLNQGFSAGGDPASQGTNTKLHRVADPYMKANGNPPGGGGQTKYAIDENLYPRTEIPLEIEAKLTSREPGVEAKKNGLFEKDAIGPALFDLITQDPYQDWMYNAAGANPLVSLYDQARQYYKRAAWKVKRGKHNDPYQKDNKPVVTYWQQHFEIGADGQEEVGETEEEFVQKEKELTVYLNGVALERDDDATADNSKRIKRDYAEISNKKIKLRKGMARQKDEVWIVREPNTNLNHPKVNHWAGCPPGDNCHENYGGIRGELPTDDMVFTLRKDFTKTPGEFAYKDMNTINLDPDKLDAEKRERVVSQVATVDGNQKGLAGIIFSPSSIAGDMYIVEARLKECPYERDLGWAGARPVGWNTKGSTGLMTVWRLNTLSESWRMPKYGTSGLPNHAGEDDDDANSRSHPADGRKMNFIGLNKQAQRGFNEWIALKEDGQIAGPNEEAHRNVDLDTYRAFFNGQNGNGFYNIPDNSEVTDEFVRWDHYREKLPPGIDDFKNAVSYAMSTVDNGKDSKEVGQEMDQEISQYKTDYQAHNPGAANVPDIPAQGQTIDVSNDTPDEYLNWVKGKCKKLANEFMDQLIPQNAPPASMRVLRWPKLYWGEVWYKGNPGQMQYKSLGIGGYCRGSGQAFFFSEQAQSTTFEHEMGHSLHLAHFAAKGITNFAWKHHDHSYQNCLMGYNAGNFAVPLRSNPKGPAIQITTSPRRYLCPKCLLKIRGWKEDVLPCNWTHPDVF